MDVAIRKSIKLLLLEDQEDDAELIKRALRKGAVAFESIRVENREDFERALIEFQPDAILSDHSLPQFNSIEALKIKSTLSPHICFILVTGAVSDEFAVQCIKLGADDYVLKSNLSRLTTSLKNAMEHRALERQRSEAVQALREQNERLTKAHKEIDAFVYSVSHNLRSPLASVLGLVTIAKLDAEKGVAETGKYLELIKKSVQKLDETIKEILDYSKNDRLDVRLESIDLAELFDDCLSSLQYLPGYEQMTKQINLSGPGPFYSDRFRVSIILINLLSNAIRYTSDHKEQKLLRIDATVTAEAAKIEITDNGIGISPARLPLVFDMFYRGTERSEGAGLGLYIAKEVVTKLGGTVTVNSKPEAFTTFTVILPNGAPA